MTTKVSLYRVKNGNHEVWLLRWHADGKRHSQTLDKARDLSKREAEALRREKEIAFGSGRERPKRTPKMGLKQFLDHDREAFQPDVSPATAIAHRNASDHAIAALGKDARVDRLTRADVGRIKKRLADAGRSRATISSVCRALRAAFNRGMAEGLIVENPFSGNVGGKTQAKPMRIFDDDEIGAMVEAAPSLWWKAFIKLAVDSGLRKSELLNLMWRDIDFNKGVVCVTAKRPGARDHLILEWSAKTYQDRAVPTLPQDTVAMLQRLKLQGDGSPYVFLSRNRLELLKSKRGAGTLRPRFDPVNNLLRNFHGIQDRARKLLAERRGFRLSDVEWPIGSVHDLRKTFGTRTADMVPMHVLRVWMGHSDIGTTTRYYLSLSDVHADRVRAAFAGNGDLKPDLIGFGASQGEQPMDQKPRSRYDQATKSA